MKNKYALITGATGGIGSAIAKKLLSDGYNLILVSRSSEKLIKLKELLQKDSHNSQIYIEVCNISDHCDVDVLFSRIKEYVSSMHILVNCAGISGGGITADIEPSLWLDVINTNLNGAFFMIQAILKRKLMSEGGRIINIASTGGKQGVIYGAPYCASKHGLVGLSKALGLELARSGSKITVNAICPGFVETEMAERVRGHYAKIWNTNSDETKKRVEERIPIGRYIEADEVASMVSYVASDVASAVTAQAINICGGLGNY